MKTNPTSLFASNHHTYLFSPILDHYLYISKHSINLTCKTNLTPLPEIQFNILNCIKPSYQPVITILHHYSYISQQSSKPSCITNLTSLSVTPIYRPYLKTNLTPLFPSNHHTYLFFTNIAPLLILITTVY